MTTLNITFNVELSVLKEWKAFMNKVFMPFAYVKKNFAGHRLYQVMMDEPNVQTYSYQLIAQKETNIDDFLSDIFPALHREMNQAFGDKVVFFSTKLKEVSLDHL